MSVDFSLFRAILTVHDYQAQGQQLLLPALRSLVGTKGQAGTLRQVQEPVLGEAQGGGSMMKGRLLAVLVVGAVISWIVVLALLIWVGVADADNPKPACVSDAVKAYTEGYDAALDAARGRCDDLGLTKAQAETCKAKLWELYANDKPSR